MARKKNTTINNEETIDIPVEGTEKVESKVLKVKVNCDKLNFRKAPGGDVIDILAKGTKLTILEDNGEWLKVEVGMETGYVMSQYISK